MLRPCNLAHNLPFVHWGVKQFRILLHNIWGRFILVGINYWARKTKPQSYFELVSQNPFWTRKAFWAWRLSLKTASVEKYCSATFCQFREKLHTNDHSWSEYAQNQLRLWKSHRQMSSIGQTTLTRAKTVSLYAISEHSIQRTGIIVIAALFSPARALCDTESCPSLDSH